MWDVNNSSNHNKQSMHCNEGVANINQVRCIIDCHTENSMCMPHIDFSHSGYRFGNEHEHGRDTIWLNETVSAMFISFVYNATHDSIWSIDRTEEPLFHMRRRRAHQIWAVLLTHKK